MQSVVPLFGSKVNVGRSEGYCQLRILFFAGFLVLSGLCGCDRDEVLPRDRLRLQLVAETFEALAAGDGEEACRLLERVQDIAPDQDFYRAALAHEQERQRTARLNARLAMGDLEGAAAVLRSADHGGAGTGALAARAQPVLDALTALTADLRVLPYASADAAAVALARQEQREALLSAPAYQAWLQRRRDRLDRLRERERRVALRELVCAYDLAVVSAAPEAGLILAQIAVLEPAHPLLYWIETGLAGDWDRVRQAAQPQSVLTPTRQAALEMAACGHWSLLPGNLRQTLFRLLRERPTASLAGALLRTLLAGAAGDAAAAANSVRELAALTTVAPSWVGILLELGVMERAQFQAGCWRSPCPAVTDFLDRVVQLREQFREDSGR